MISACSSSVIFPLLSGEFQFGVRWYTTSSATSLATSGMSCTPLAPVPITATFLPAKSTGSLGHWPVWYASPWYRSRPGIDGQYGTDSTPVADTTKRERSCVPSSVVSAQVALGSSKVAEAMRVRNCMRSRRPSLSTTKFRYASVSA